MICLFISLSMVLEIEIKEVMHRPLYLLCKWHMFYNARIELGPIYMEDRSC